MEPPLSEIGSPQLPGSGPDPATLGGTQAPPSVPEHTLIKLIGRGSSGDVWLARNTMGVYRAVKIVSRQRLGAERPFERELEGIRKFEPISRTHEGFVDVLHVGLHKEEGYLYYVMELGDDVATGQEIDPERFKPLTLSHKISAQGRLTWDECLGLGMSLTSALVHLHKNKLVHRDIKPLNIIYVNGVPKLADIGLVTEENAQSIVGTPGYVPLQGPGTQQADIFALGKVLYESSTGKDRAQYPDLPTRWDDEANAERFREFNEILIRACHPATEGRYRSADEMYADLVVLVNGKSVRRLRLLERRLATVKRWAFICGLAVIAGVLAYYPFYRDRKEAVRTRERDVGQNIAYGNRSLESGDYPAALRYFAEGMKLDSDTSVRSLLHRARCGSVLAQCPRLLQLLTIGTNEISDVSFSPTGNQVLVIQDRYPLGEAQVWDLNSGTTAWQSGFTQGVASGSFSLDGRYLAYTTGSSNLHIQLVQTSDWQKQRCLKHPDMILSIRFSADSRRILTACADGFARLWDLETRMVIKKFPHSKKVFFAAFSHKGRRLVTASEDSKAIVWGTNGTRELVLGHCNNWVNHAAFSPDDEQVITSCEEHHAHVWNATTGAEILPKIDQRDVVKWAEFSPDGRFICVAGLDNALWFYSAKTHQPLTPNPIIQQNDRVLSACFNAEGNRIVVGCLDGTVRVWDFAACKSAPEPLIESLCENRSRFLRLTNNSVEIYDTLSRQPVRSFEWQTHVMRAALSADGQFVLASLGERKSDTSAMLDVREVSTGRQPGAPVPAQGDPAQMTISSDGRWLVSFAGQVAHSWNLETGASTGSVDHQMNVQGVLFNPKHPIVVSWGGKHFKVWNAETGKGLFEKSHDTDINHVEFSPDGAKLVTTDLGLGYDKSPARVWNVMTGECEHDFRQGDGILWATFSHDSSLLATAGEDSKAVVWNLKTGEKQAVGMHHDDQVKMVSFSPDDKWIVTVGARRDSTARIWSVESGHPVAPPLHHSAGLESAYFLNDGLTIITTDTQDHFYRWTIPLAPLDVEGTVGLSRLLTSDQINPVGALKAAAEAEPLGLVLQKLRRNYSSWFDTTPTELQAWHEWAFAQSEMETNRVAAEVHYKYLEQARPDDSDLKHRLDAIISGSSQGKSP